MNLIEIPDRSLTLQIPSHYDEMPTASVHYCLSQAIAVTHDRQTILDAQVKSLYHLLGLKRTWRTIALEKIKPAAWTQAKNTNLNELAKQTITFLFKTHQTETETILEINYPTIRNHFPVISIPNTQYQIPNTQYQIPNTQYQLPNTQYQLYGPQDLLSDLTFGEFRAAIEEMDEYFHIRTDSDAKPAEIQHQMSRFIACLYRPQRQDYHKISQTETFDGQIREPFNRAHIDKNAKLCARLDHVTRTAILLWFTYCVEYIQTQELTISGRTITFKPLFPKPKTDTVMLRHSKHDNAESSRRNAGAWTSILYNIAKEGLFGNATETDRTGLFDILIYLYDQHQQAQKAKQNAKR